jgi:hypothetical protein
MAEQDERRGALLQPVMEIRKERTAGRVDPRDPNRRQYFEDYGMVMSKAQHGQAVESEAAIDEQIAKAQGDLDTARSTFESDYEKQNKKLAGMESGIPDWDTFRKKELREVRITDKSGTQLEQTYYLPPEAIDKLWGDEQFRKAYTSARYEDGSMNIIPYIDGEPYGKELHEELGKAQQTIYNQFLAKTKEAQSIFSREIGGARSALSTQYETGQAQLSQLETEIEQKRQEKAEYKSLLKKKYEEKLSRIMGTLKGLK